MALSSSTIVQVKEAEREDEELHFNLTFGKMAGKCVRIALWDTAKLKFQSHTQN